jgi:hypothetical protein
VRHVRLEPPSSAGFVGVGLGKVNRNLVTVPSVSVHATVAPFGTCRAEWVAMFAATAMGTGGAGNQS